MIELKLIELSLIVILGIIKYETNCSIINYLIDILLVINIVLVIISR